MRNIRVTHAASAVTLITRPVTNAASSRARKETVTATSSTVPGLPSGISSRVSSRTRTIPPGSRRQPDAVPRRRPASTLPRSPAPQLPPEEDRHVRRGREEPTGSAGDCPRSSRAGRWYRASHLRTRTRRCQLSEELDDKAINTVVADDGRSSLGVPVAFLKFVETRLVHETLPFRPWGKVALQVSEGSCRAQP